MLGFFICKIMAKDYCTYQELSEDEQYLLWQKDSWNCLMSDLLEYLKNLECDSFAAITLIYEIIQYLTPYHSEMQDHTGTYEGYCTRSKNGVVSISYADKAEQFGCSLDSITKHYIDLEKANCIEIYNAKELNTNRIIEDVTYIYLNVATIRNLSKRYSEIFKK